MAERKHQHYVPAFYLRNFSRNNDDKTIGIYNRAKRKYISSGSIKNQAYSDYFYGKDGKIEKQLGITENKASKIIARIISDRELPEFRSREHFDLLAFILFLSSRTEYSAECLNELADKQFKTMFAGTSLSKDEINKYTMKFDNPASFRLSVTADSILSGICMDLKYKLIVNKTDNSLITSDNPVVKYNQFLEHKKTVGSNIGLGLKGLQIFLPINPKMSLIFYDSDVYEFERKKQEIIELNNKKDIRELNLLQFVNANDNIYFNHQVSEKYIRSIMWEGKKYLRKNKAHVKEYISTNKKGSLMHNYYEDTRTNLALSFISLSEKAKKYELGNQVAHYRNPELMKKILEKFERPLLNKLEKDKSFIKGLKKLIRAIVRVFFNINKIIR